jgi:hypothetical protein
MNMCKKAESLYIIYIYICVCRQKHNIDISFYINIHIQKQDNADLFIPLDRSPGSEQRRKARVRQ